MLSLFILPQNPTVGDDLRSCIAKSARSGTNSEMCVDVGYLGSYWAQMERIGCGVEAERTARFLRELFSFILQSRWSSTFHSLSFLWLRLQRSLLQSHCFFIDAFVCKELQLDLLAPLYVPYMAVFIIRAMNIAECINCQAKRIYKKRGNLL